MPKKSDRNAIGLNLTPELPQVVSRDFNLFYTPQPEPLPAGVKEFASALDNFVNNGGTKATLLAEQEQKQAGVAEAQQAILTNQESFKELVKSGAIPPTANPYFLEKYKELTLNRYASEFTAKISDAYGTEGMEKKLEPTAFNDFYKRNLAQFIKEKDLAGFNPVDLEKGFFKVTSANRNNLETHHNSQIQKHFIKEFDFNLGNNIYGIVTQFKNYNKFDYPEAGADFNKFAEMSKVMNSRIQGIMGTGYDPAKVNRIVLDGIEKYVANISTDKEEIKYAKAIVNELPKYLQSGTNTYENIGAVKGWQNRLNRELVKKTDEALKDEISLTKNILTADQQAGYEQAEEMKQNAIKNGKVFTNADVEELKKGQSTDFNLGIDSWITNQRFAGGTKDNFATIEKIETALKNADTTEAVRLVNEGLQKGQLLPATANDYLTKYISDAQKGKNTAVLNHLPIKEQLEAFENAAKESKTGGDKSKFSFVSNHLRNSMRNWERDNIDLPKYKLPNGKVNNSLFLKDAEIHFIEQSDRIQKISALNGVYGLGKEFTATGTLSGAVETLIQEKENKEKAKKDKVIESNKGKKNADVQKLWEEYYKANPNLKPKQ
jgi:hypothetical protein